MPIQPITPIFAINGLDWQCFLVGSSKTAPRILIFFSIAMGADYSFELKNIEIWVPAFFKHNNSSVVTVWTKAKIWKISSNRGRIQARIFVGSVLFIISGLSYWGWMPNLKFKSWTDSNSGTLFQIAETAVTTGTRMFVNSLARERYPINYVYGFSSEGFSYFLTTQMKQVRQIISFLLPILEMVNQ